MIEDKRRWRRHYVRIWDDPTFQRLSDGEKLMAEYILFGPQTNRIGLYKMSCGMGMEHLRWSLRVFGNRMEKVCLAFGWHYDPTSQVIWIPSWWDYNPPINTDKNMSGVLTDLATVPNSPLIARFASHLVYVPEGLHKYFTFILDRQMKKAPFEQGSNWAPHTVRTQEQEQEQEKEQDQKQDEEGAETSSAPPVLMFPTVGPVAAWALTAAQLAKWQGLYPALDVLGECRKALGWCDANARKRKTAGGMPAFLNRWLSKQVDSPRGGSPSAPILPRRLQGAKPSDPAKWMVPDDEPIV